VFHAVILVGGSGTRFWPLSRERMPKQLLSILGNRSMLAITVDRSLAMVPENRIWAVTTVSQAALRRNSCCASRRVNSRGKRSRPRAADLFNWFRSPRAVSNPASIRSRYSTSPRIENRSCEDQKSDWAIKSKAVCLFRLHSSAENLSPRHANCSSRRQTSSMSPLGLSTIEARPEGSTS